MIIEKRSSTVSCDNNGTKVVDKKDSIIYLVKEQKWSKAISVISRKYKSIDKDSASELLFLACELDPPQRFIDTLIDLHPQIIFGVDSPITKKTPLHVACEYGASPYVIEPLIRKNRESLVARDYEGKLPLHKACESYAMNYNTAQEEEMSDDASEMNLFETLEVLLEYEPRSILEEDKDGICPIEHAILSDSSRGIIQYLRKISERERRLTAHLQESQQR